MEVVAEPFAASVVAWHDFYAAVAAATAALLGLLFVAVSIRLSSSPKANRLEERSRAVTVFGNLIAALVLALVILIPNQGARSVALQLAIVTVVSLARVVRRGADVVRRRASAGISWGGVRRLAWTAFGVVMLGYVVGGLWLNGDPGYLYALLAAVFVFLIGAADASWDLLLPDDEVAEAS